MVLYCSMLHPELKARVSGAAHVHSLWVEDVDLEKVAGHQLMKPVRVPSPLHLAQYHQSPSFIDLSDSYRNTINVTHYHCSSDDIQ